LGIIRSDEKKKIECNAGSSEVLGAVGNNSKNEPSREPPTNDQMINDQTTIPRLEWDTALPNILLPKQGEYSLSQKQDAELPSKITISTTQFTSNISHKFENVNGINTSYMFEAVNGVNTKPFETVNSVSNVHDKYIVTNQVTFSDERENEIQSENATSNSQPNEWRMPVKINLDSSGLKRSARSAVLSRREKVYSHSMRNEVRNMHAWFSSRPSAPSVRIEWWSSFSSGYVTKFFPIFKCY